MNRVTDSHDLTPGQRAYLKQLWDFGRRTTQRRYPPGVWKFRSIEEMNREQESQALSRPN